MHVHSLGRHGDAPMLFARLGYAGVRRIAEFTKRK